MTSDRNFSGEVVICLSWKPQFSAFASVSKTLKIQFYHIITLAFLESNLLSNFFFQERWRLLQKTNYTCRTSCACPLWQHGHRGRTLACQNQCCVDNNFTWNIALLKHHQVRGHYTPLQGPWVPQYEWTMFLISSFPPLAPISSTGTARKTNYTSSDGVAGQLWEVITWEAEFDERSDLYTPSWLTAKQVIYIISNYLSLKKKPKLHH